MKPRPRPRLIGIKRVAHLLNCSERTVYRLVEQGQLSAPRKLPGGQVRWFPADVKVYLYRLKRGDFEGVQTSARDPQTSARDPQSPAKRPKREESP